MKIKAFSFLVLLIVVFAQCKTVSENVQTTPQTNSQTNFDTILSDFKTPTSENTLWCYWYWIGDDISKDGITKDLEAMKAAGIGGALIGNINPKEKDGKVPMLSEEWWSHMVHAVKEAKRIGIEIGSFNCPGWSQSGGPWVSSEMAMRYMVHSEIKVTGGQKVTLNLVKPTSEFQDTYVLAFPSISAEENFLQSNNARIEVTPSIKNKDQLIDGNASTFGSFSKGVREYQIDIIAEQAITARSLEFKLSKDVIIGRCEVLAEIDGEFKAIKTFDIDRSNLDPAVGPDRYAPIVVALPKTNAKNFRIKFQSAGALVATQEWGLSEIVISEAAKLEDYVEKNLGKMHPTPFPAWDSYLWAGQEEVSNDALKVQSSEVIDISDKMDANGNLSWDAPKGSWTIQRFGMTPTGTKNSPSAPQGKGYEVDKASKKLAKFHYEQYIGELLKRIPEESRSAFKYVIADSYEQGSQNWTDDFEVNFESEFGYNPKKFLPVFSGRIVGSVEESDRFLWDLRRSTADAVAHQYVGGLKETSNEDNLKLWLENYGHWGFPSEFLMYGGQSDLVAGEFWNEGSLGDIECKSASSAAHIYGKPRVSAEAFTAASRTYVRHPAMLKKRGDWSLTEGINHFVLHLYIHQPDDNRVPGVNAWFSTEFNRHNTWFEKSKVYFEYLRRSQYLLQQGRYAADVCYFIGEDAPIMTGVRNPELPEGYSYDYINAEVILERLSVKDGKFVLPDGMSYSLMVLPPFETMRPELLEKIESLVSQGGKIFGQAPKKSPSLQNYPESDIKVQEIAKKMWGSSDEKIKKYGEGFIVDGLELKDALDHLKIITDVNLNEEVPVLWTHRTMPGMEIYFLTNQSEEEISFTPSFRVQGMKPQLWNAVTGEIRVLNEFVELNGHTSVPITMEPLQSWFVVFSNATVDLNNAYTKNFPNAEIVKTLNNSWKVDFKNKDIGPSEIVDFPVLTDWIENADDRIKYYSGTAVYTSTFNFEKKDLVNDLSIDLGKVGVLATVKINGIEVGSTWIAPNKLNIAKAVKEGKNTIEIEVVNVWRNRLTGDKELPESERTTWIIEDGVEPHEELISSGLLGPVIIQSVK